MSLALLIGDRQSGKTTACQRLAELACARGVTVGGIVAPAVRQGGRCVGYDVLDLGTGHCARLASVDGPGVEQIGRFHFSSEGLAFGREALARAIEEAPGLVIVDEVGPLELAGGGWAEHLEALAGREGAMVFAVRRDVAAAVVERWGVGSGGAGVVGRTEMHDLAQGADAAVDALVRLAER